MPKRKMPMPPLPNQAELNNQLLDAVEHSDTAAVSALIAIGSDVNAETRLGDSALIRAVLNIDIATVTALLTAPDIDVNFKNRSGRSALLQAILFKHTPIVKALLAAGADINMSQGAPLRMTVMHNDVETVTALLSVHSLMVNQLDREGYTVLMYAAEKGEIGIVLAILNASRLDVDVNVATRITQDTTLMLAIKGGHIEVIKALIPHLRGEALNTVTNVFGHNALMIAVQEGKAKAITALIPHLAKSGLNFANRTGETALMMAARNADLDCVNALILGLDRASLNLKNRAGKTALMLAIDRGFLPTILALISALDAPSLNIKDEMGRTPLNRATQVSRLDIVEALILKGANLHLKDNSQLTALKIASNLNHLGIAFRLLSEMGPQELTELQASDLGPLVRQFKANMLDIQMGLYHTLRTFHLTSPFASLEGPLKSVFDFDRESKPKWYHHRMDRDISSTIEKLNSQLKEKEAKAERDRQAHILAETTVMPCLVSKKRRKPVVFSCLKKRVRLPTTEYAAEPQEVVAPETTRRNPKRLHSFMGSYTK
jgi:ankyrin repeat protein